VLHTSSALLVAFLYPLLLFLLAIASGDVTSVLFHYPVRTSQTYVLITSIWFIWEFDFPNILKQSINYIYQLH
jgi:hypothetical protein